MVGREAGGGVGRRTGGILVRTLGLSLYLLVQGVMIDFFFGLEDSLFASCLLTGFGLCMAVIAKPDER